MHACILTHCVLCAAAQLAAPKVATSFTVSALVSGRQLRARSPVPPPLRMVSGVLLLEWQRAVTQQVSMLHAACTPDALHTPPGMPLVQESALPIHGARQLERGDMILFDRRCLAPVMRD